MTRAIQRTEARRRSLIRDGLLGEVVETDRGA
jgi:hypothetical protein